MCILCKTIVRSEDVWKVHVNAKQHKQNVELAKKNANSMPPPPAPMAQSSKQSTTVTASKRMAPPPIPEVPAKIPKGILKNGPSHKPNNSSSQATDTTTMAETNALPDNFFDNPPRNANFYEATLTKTTIKTNLVNIKRSATDSEKMDETSDESGNAEQQKDESLPEGFFDDPIKDAKARNSEYKDPVEEEWEKFQQEIKAASDFSNAIIAEDQEEAITERQIDEIDEQIRNWNRYSFFFFRFFHS